MRTLASAHPSSSCCLFCFPLFNCSGPLLTRSRSKDPSLTRDSLSQSTPPATPSHVTRACASVAVVSHISLALSRGSDPSFPSPQIHCFLAFTATEMYNHNNKSQKRP